MDQTSDLQILIPHVLYSCVRKLTKYQPEELNSWNIYQRVVAGAKDRYEKWLWIMGFTVQEGMSA